MVKCADCGKAIPEDHDLRCDMCGDSLCQDCEITEFCSIFSMELLEAEIGLENKCLGEIEVKEE